jgi:hypothetical protein
MPQTKIYTERQFGNLTDRLFPCQLNKYKGWKREITVLYTHGKDAAWSFHPNPGQAAGAVSDAFLVKNEKKICGGAVIDIKQIIEGNIKLSIAAKTAYEITRPGGPAMPKPGGLAIKSRKPSLAESRYEVLVILAHELFHFTQYWNTGDMKLSQQIYTREFNRLKEQAKRENPDLSDLDAKVRAHARHSLEQQAERNARQAVARYKAEIDAGAWDRFVPMEDIRWYAAKEIQ